MLVCENVPNLNTTTPKKSWAHCLYFGPIQSLLNTPNFMSISTNEHNFKVSMKFSKYFFDLGKDQI